jgi:hypothetical protein
MARRCPHPALLALTFALAACGSDPVGPGGNEREIKANPSFATDINEIFQRRGCSAAAPCHGAPGGQAGLMLTASATNNYGMLVDVDATSESFKRVLPGTADDSYLVIKLEGRQQVGTRMPQNAAPLDNIDLTNIKNWINNGAPNN